MTMDGSGLQQNPGERHPPLRAPVLGVLFLVAGAALLLGSLYPEATVARLWPLFLLVPVAVLGQVLLERRRAAAGVLVPIGVLSYLTVFFLWLNFTSWARMASAWPNFLLAPALGLFLLFLATRRAQLLVPVAALTIVAAVFLGGLQRSIVAIALVLMVVGVLLLVGPVLRRRKV